LQCSHVSKYKHIKSVFVFLATSAVSVALPAFAAVRRAAALLLLSTGQRAIEACRAHSSKPAAAACGGQTIGRIDRQTDRQPVETDTRPLHGAINACVCRSSLVRDTAYLTHDAAAAAAVAVMVALRLTNLCRHQSPSSIAAAAAAAAAGTALVCCCGCR